MKKPEPIELFLINLIGNAAVSIKENCGWSGGKLGKGWEYITLRDLMMLIEMNPKKSKDKSGGMFKKSL